MNRISQFAKRASGFGRTKEQTKKSGSPPQVKSICNPSDSLTIKKDIKPTNLPSSSLPSSSLPTPSRASQIHVKPSLKQNTPVSSMRQEPSTQTMPSSLGVQKPKTQKSKPERKLSTIEQLIKKNKSLIKNIRAAGGLDSRVDPRLTDDEKKKLRLLALYEQISDNSSTDTISEYNFSEFDLVQKASITDYLTQGTEFSQGLKEDLFRQMKKEFGISITTGPLPDAQKMLIREIKAFINKLDQRHSKELKTRLEQVYSRYTESQVNPIRLDACLVWIDQLKSKKKQVLESIQNHASGKVQYVDNGDGINGKFIEDIGTIVKSMKLNDFT